MEENEKTMRITYKQSQPNPLFQSWLQELYDEAKEKRSKLESMLEKALDSLTKYPLPLQSGSECAILKGFGKKLCLFLDQKLEAYRAPTPCDSISTSQSAAAQKPGPPIPQICSKDALEPMEADTQSVSSSKSAKTSKSKSPKGRKPYKPSFKSGGYAILIVLLNNLKENQSSTGLTKEELIEKAQPLSEESFTRPKADSHYTAWSNMSRLITKGLIEKSKSRKAIYSLSPAGISLAIQLEDDSRDVPSANDIIFNDASFSNNSDANTGVKPVEKCKSIVENCEESLNNVIEMQRGSFDVILLIDKNETSGYV